jgi:ribosomal protein S24E
MAELKIIQETENPLFKRKEILADWTDNTLPKATDVAQTLSEKFSVPLENVALKNIIGKFGSKTFEVQANIYENQEELNKTEPKHNRPAPKEEPKAEAAPAETSAEPAAEQPAEEKTE